MKPQVDADALGELLHWLDFHKCRAPKDPNRNLTNPDEVRAFIVELGRWVAELRTRLAPFGLTLKWDFKPADLRASLSEAEGVLENARKQVLALLMAATVRDTEALSTADAEGRGWDTVDDDTVMLIQRTCAELRKLVAESADLAPRHKQRLLRAIDHLSSLAALRVTSLDRVLGVMHAIYRAAKDEIGGGADWVIRNHEPLLKISQELRQIYGIVAASSGLAPLPSGFMTLPRLDPGACEGQEANTESNDEESRNARPA